MGKIEDNEPSISIRVLRSFDEATLTSGSMMDIAIQLASADDRENLSTMQKIADALAFLKSRIH